MAQHFSLDVCPDTGNACGCPTCLITSDKFNRADETPVAAPWSKLSGTNANLSSSYLDFVAAAFYKHTTAYPGAATENRHAKVKFTLNGTDDSVELAIGLTDKDNYFFARATIPASGCPVLIAGAMTATAYNVGIGDPGADVLLEGLDYGIAQITVPGLATSEQATLEVCLLPNTGSYGYSSYDELRVKLTLADGTIYATRWWVDGPAIGDYAGLKTTDTAQFDDFEYTYFRNSPTDEHRTCPNCNTPCEIGSDDFTVDEPCNWHQASGSAYSVSGGLMNVAASSSVAFHLPHPMYKTSAIITVDLYWDIGIIARVDLGCGAGGGTNGAGYVLLDSTLLEMRLYDNAGTLLETATGLPAVDSAAHAVELCHHDGVITATAFGQCIGGSTTGTVTNPYAFLGASAGNAPQFDNFVFKKHLDTTEPSDGGCEVCECLIDCPQCLDGTGPGLMKIVMPSDITAGLSGSCSTCDEIIGSKIADGGCPWIWSSPLSDCGKTVSVDVLGPGDAAWDASTTATYRIQVTLTVTTIFGSGQEIWLLDVGATAPDCTAFVDLEIPWVGETDDFCITTGSLPVYVTSL